MPGGRSPPGLLLLTRPEDDADTVAVPREVVWAHLVELRLRLSVTELDRLSEACAERVDAAVRAQDAQADLFRVYDGAVADACAYDRAVAVGV